MVYRWYKDGRGVPYVIFDGADGKSKFILGIYGTKDIPKNQLV